MKGRKQLIIFLILSVLAGTACTACLYCCFPKFLCYSVYDASESDLYEKNEEKLDETEEYLEKFVPENHYIKTIAVHVRIASEEEVTSNEEPIVYAELMDSENHILAKGKNRLEESGLLEFKMECWVKPGQEYQLKMQFENCGNVYLTSGPEDTKPREHRALLKDGKEMQECLYLKFAYGNYSRKLLFLWFAAFFFGASALIGKAELIMKMQKQKRNHHHAAAILLLFCLLFLTACGQTAGEIETEKKNTGFIGAKTGVYDSADTAVIADLDTEEKTITLKNMEVKRQYTLYYDGTTYFYDKYGKVISAAQLPKGEIVDVTFFKQAKRLNSLQLSSEAWCHRDISEYELDEEKLQVEIGSAVYAYTDDIVVISDGEQADIIDVNPVDVLTFRGIGTELYSIVIEKGHGYVRLKNEEYFYGGWIEIGNKVICKVAENMLLTVPEGEHQVIISNKGTSGVKQIEVRKNTELELDVGDLKGAEPQYGSVVFTITPEEALLYLDGEKTDYTSPVRLEYGIHQMIVMADGYETITQYLKVGQASAGIEVAMKEREGVSGNDVSGSDGTADSELLDEVNKILEEKGYDKISASDLENYGSGTGTGNGTESTTGTSDGIDSTESSTDTDAGTGSAVTSALSYYVTIDAPTGVEVYLDGNYVGIAPCSFKKEAGSHTITLRKTGYIAKAYTVQIDSEEKNISYSFLDLVALE